jgi:TRAP-type C4-dicarboxylate transport system substrate-binding protein
MRVEFNDISETIEPIREATMRGSVTMKATKLLGAAAICLALATPVSAMETEVSIAYNAPKKSAMAKAIKGFIKDANAALAGKAKIVRFKSKKGGKNDKKVVKKLKKGKLDIGIVSINAAKAVRKPFGAFEMPWLITDSAQAKTLLGKKKGVGKKIKRWTSRSKFVLVGTMTRGFQYLATYEKKFTKPADLKGLWINSANSGFTQKALKAYGAKPGNSDGVITSLKAISKKRKSYQTAPKYVSNVPMTFTPAMIIFSKKNKKLKKLLMTKYVNKKGKTKWKWNDLGKEIAKAAKKAAKTSFDGAAANDKKAWEKINKSKKLSVTKIDLGAFREASVPLYHKYEGFVNGGFGTMNQIRKIAGTNAGS